MHRRQLLAFIFFFFALTSAIQPGYAAKKGYIAPEQVPGTTLVTAAEAKALHDNGVVFMMCAARAYTTGAIYPGWFTWI